MSKAALLHIGTRKTGTTSIQEALAAAGGRLGQIRYPMVNGERNHNRLVTLFLPHDELPLHWSRPDPADDRKFDEERLRYRQLLFDELESAKGAILSGEALSSFFDRSAAENLRSALEGVGFREFVVVLYIRDPADYFLSLMQQFLKTSPTHARVRCSCVANCCSPTFRESGQHARTTEPLETTPELHPATFKYELRRIAETWEHAFPGSLVVRRFPGDENGDVVQNFSALTQQYLGVTIPSIPARMNPTISAEGMQIIQDYRRTFWPNNRSRTTPDTAKLVKFLENSVSDLVQTRPRLKQEVADLIRVNHRAEAEFISSRYGVDLDLGSPKVTRAEGESNDHRTQSVGDLLQAVDSEIVYQLLLRLARAELEPPPKPPTVKRSLPRRLAGRAYRAIRS